MIPQRSLEIPDCGIFPGTKTSPRIAATSACAWSLAPWDLSPKRRWPETRCPRLTVPTVSELWSGYGWNSFWGHWNDFFSMKLDLNIFDEIWGISFRDMQGIRQSWRGRRGHLVLAPTPQIQPPKKGLLWAHPNMRVSGWWFGTFGLFSHILGC